jgi:hypothetical protein
MELLIAGGIALMGYNLSTPGRAPRRPRQKYASQLGPSTEYAAPGDSTLDLTRAHVARAEQRWRDARDPQLTGIVTPHTKLTNAMLPFFTSAKKQNTNDAVKQTLLETFTGATAMDASLTGTYRKKREVEAMFSPAVAAGAVTSGGTTGNQQAGPQRERFEAGAWQNNVLPAEKVYVGRGVGVGPDVAATDGFHPMHRVMLKNVGEYKKNNLPGRVNHGASLNPNTASQGDSAVGTAHSVNHNPGALVLPQERRPMMPSLAAVLAPANHGDAAAVKRPRIHDSDRFGAPAAGLRGSGRVRAFREARLGYEDGADHHDRNHSLPALNVTGAAAGVGAFTSYSVDCARLASQQREMRNSASAGLAAVGPLARRVPAGQLLPPTQRDMTSTAYFGPSARNDRGAAVRHQEDARLTLRDTQGGNPALFGTIAAVKGGTMDNVWRYKRLGRDGANKRPSVTDRQPLPARTNVVDPHASLDNVGLRAEGSQAPAPFIPSLPNKSYAEELGRLTTPHNKLPSANPRLQDLDLAAKQLRDNPYAYSIAG